jgi:MoaA/NifB/PqqE/SkfB family radical SAM enzyme
VDKEQVLCRFLGVKLVGFRKEADGEIVGTGLLNPLIEKLGLFTTIYFQARFYRQYENLARKNGRRVSNVFAPPAGSMPQFRALWSLVKSRLLMRPFPTAVTFAVTYRCQAHCPHCSAGNHVRTDVPELSAGEAKRAIDETTGLGVSVIAFTGGEPLVRNDIFALVSHVDKRKAIAHLFTNGLLLTDENVKRLVDAGLYTLFLSLDSHIPEEHDRLRGIPGLFDRGLEGLRKLKENGVFIGISSYASRSGTARGDYKKMYELARRVGAHNFVLFDCVPTGSLIKDTSELLDTDQREEIIEYTVDIFRRRQIPPLTSQAWQNSIQGYLGGIGCVAGCIQYYISAYGDIAPCDFTPLSFGNMREESIRKIWKRMIAHPAYRHRSQFCRMQNPRFRGCYIDPIPEGASLPYDIGKFPRVDYRKTKAPGRARAGSPASAERGAAGSETVKMEKRAVEIR